MSAGRRVTRSTRPEASTASAEVASTARPRRSTCSADNAPEASPSAAEGSTVKVCARRALRSASRCEHRLAERATVDAGAPRSSSRSTAASTRASYASAAAFSLETDAAASHNPGRSNSSTEETHSVEIQSSNTRTSSSARPGDHMGKFRLRTELTGPATDETTLRTGCDTRSFLLSPRWRELRRRHRLRTDRP